MTPMEPVLVVDDEQEVRDTLAAALSDGGYQVATVCDAAAALSALEVRDFPVVLTDLHMPGQSGLDLITEIRARHPSTLCVVITGYASLETAVESLQRGAYDFIQKPFRIAQVEATLNRALDYARNRKQLVAYQHRLEEMVVARTADLRDLHDEVVRLNDLLIAAQDQEDVDLRVRPFLDHFQARYQPDALAALLPGPDGWRVSSTLGSPCWTLGELEPLLDHLFDARHLPAGLGHLEEGFLLPLRRGERLLGVVVVGFRHRSAFSPGESRVDFWRRGLEAALLGWLQAHPTG